MVFWISALLVLASAVPNSPAVVADWHLADDMSRALFLRSSFAHGYVHGYEEGFHHGDQAAHIARRRCDAEATLKRISRLRGDGRFFREGFDQGFLSGFTDAFYGREFRALAVVRQVAPAATTPAARNEAFDSGFRSGYRVAASPRRSSARGAARCEAVPANEKELAFCDGFARGQRLGASDAEVAELHRDHLAARK